VVWAALLGASPAVAGTVVDRVAAVVGDEVVALSEVYDLGEAAIASECPTAEPTCVRRVELEVLDAAILRVLVRQELGELGIDVSARDLEMTIDGIAEDNGLDSAETLRREVERGGTPWDVYQAEIRDQLRELRFQKWVVEPRIPVTEDELVDFYRRSARELAGPAKRTFHSIVWRVDPAAGDQALSDAVMLATGVRDAVLSGAVTWDDAVTTHHTGAAGSGPRGEGFPPVKPGDLAGALDTVIFATPVGEIAPPVIVGSFLFLVKVVDEQAVEVAPFEQVRERLVEAVKEQKSAVEIEQWYLEARRKAAVRVLLEPV
jgi:parvulin-like peptidyl-prolyl isomerase